MGLLYSQPKATETQSDKTQNETNEKEQVLDKRLLWPCIDLGYSVPIMLQLKLDPVSIIEQLNQQKFPLEQNYTALFTNLECIELYFGFLREYLKPESARIVCNNKVIQYEPLEYDDLDCINYEQYKNVYLIIKVPSNICASIFTIYNEIMSNNTRL